MLRCRPPLHSGTDNGLNKLSKNVPRCDMRVSAMHAAIPGSEARLAHGSEVLAMLCQWRRSAPEAEESVPLTLGRTIQACWELAPGADGRSLRGAIGNVLILARVRCHVTRASLARRLRAAMSRFRAQCLCNGQRLSARCRSGANSRAAWRIWRVASCASCVQDAGKKLRASLNNQQYKDGIPIMRRTSTSLIVGPFRTLSATRRSARM